MTPSSEWRATRRSFRWLGRPGRRRGGRRHLLAGAWPYSAPVASDPVELLDRQHTRLQAQGGPEFVHELRRFYEFITAGPDAVTGTLAELRAEAQRIEGEFEEHDEALVPELINVKEQFVTRAPEADDSARPRPQQMGAPSMEWAYSLANFDQVATIGPDRNVVRQSCDTSRSGMMLRILEHKLRALQWYERPEGPNPKPSETNLRPDLDDLVRDVGNLGERHRHAAQTFGQAVEGHGGFGVMYLDMAVGEMNPPPRRVESDADKHAWMDETFRRVMGGWQVIEDVAAGRSLDSTARQTLDIHIERLKPAAERVYEDLRMKLATAPAPPPPEQDYGERLKAWASSPGYGLLGGPFLSGLVTQTATVRPREASCSSSAPPSSCSFRRRCAVRCPFRARCGRRPSSSWRRPLLSCRCSCPGSAWRSWRSRCWWELSSSARAPRRAREVAHTTAEDSAFTGGLWRSVGRRAGLHRGAAAKYAGEVRDRPREPRALLCGMACSGHHTGRR